ncbi:MAG: LuxR C-terminal-related transcriptional regulator [Pseudorhodobacter sp.]
MADRAGGGRSGSTILVADAQDLVRDTIAAFLLVDGVSRVATAATLDEAVDHLATERFDLALLDHDMPTMQGLTGLSTALESSNGAYVALMAGNNRRELACAALDRGAIGFVSKRMSAEWMAAAVRLMVQGKVFVPAELLTSEAAPMAPLASLSSRETSVLRGLCEGKSNKEIGRDLSLQEVTVKLYVSTLIRKLQAKNRTHVAMIARDYGFH